MCRARPKLLLLLLLGVAAVGSSESLEIARERASAGSHDEAIEAFRKWLSENEDDSRHTRAAIELSVLLDDLNERYLVLSNAIENAEDPADRHDALRALAIAAEGLGDLAEAQQLFRDASFALPDEKDFESLLDSALISFELGQYRNAEAQSRVIIETVKDARLRIAATVLLSRIYYVNDRDEDAIDLLTEVTEGEEGELDAPGLYWMFRLSTLMGLDDVSDYSVDRLETHYAESVEAALIRGEVRRVPTPSALLEATGVGAVPEISESTTESIVETDSAVTTIAEPQSTTGMVQIQTGSFTVKENAEYAAADLRDAGFTSSIEERVVSDTLYYRVVVPDVQEDEINRVLIELKEEGFEGYPIYE